MADDWPKRIAMPALNEAVKKLTWIADCLLPSDPRQYAATARVRIAVDELKAAIAELAGGE